jgi:hypothetical protein
MMFPVAHRAEGEERVREATTTLQGKRQPPSPGSFATLTMCNRVVRTG